ncbi:hypothetical protein BGZ93_008210 [Podila epicladia]|nr:hypothetical protein BGZ92_009767 [Podila epicladia]KAG0092697.1 hypothetical protein BGZ93_008210 [Podila epicladia]
MATGNDTLNNLMASSAAALCSRLCTHPLDTVKTRVQVANTPQHLVPTFLHLFRTGGLYRGLPIALTLSVPGLSVYLTTYDVAKEALSKQFPAHVQDDSVVNHMLSAGVAEVCSGLFWTPMEVLKQKQQIETTGSRTVSSTSAQQPQPVRTKTLDLAKMIYRREGLAGFYRGYFITLGVFVPYSMLYFASYEQMKQMAWARQKQRSGATMGSNQDHETLSFMTIVGCAAVACGFAAGVSNIVDVVKTRWQTSVLTKNTELSSTRKIAEAMFQQGGLISFTRGMGARILWMVPSVTISMSTFEWLKFNGFA